MPRWDSLAKQRQSERIRKQKPWLSSSGPLTEYGRWVSSQNARKHRRRQNVTSVSPAQESDTERPLEIDDHVAYLGGYEPTMRACGNELMVVAGFCQLGTGAIACQTVGGRIIWIYPRDLERCHVGMKQHGANKRS